MGKRLSSSHTFPLCRGHYVETLYQTVCIKKVRVRRKKAKITNVRLFHATQGRGVPPKYAGFVHIQVCYVRALARKNLGIWGSWHKNIRKRGNFTQKNAKKNTTKDKCIWVCIGRCCIIIALGDERDSNPRISDHYPEMESTVTEELIPQRCSGRTRRPPKSEILAAPILVVYKPPIHRGTAFCSKHLAARCVLEGT